MYLCCLVPSLPYLQDIWYEPHEEGFGLDSGQKGYRSSCFCPFPNYEKHDMMIAREEDDDATKQEGINTADEKINNSKASSSSVSSWSRLKDPRIVRVSRAFGGKDRHSKVCTVRGLRDRRVRLSVPTAIQLYDLQDRLGLNQPSKVVDWLLNAAKQEIDELPPLQMPPGNNFSQHLQPPPVLASQGVSAAAAAAAQSSRGLLKIGNSINWDDPTEPISGSNSTWNSPDALLRNKAKEPAAREPTDIDDKETWTRRNEEEKQSHFEYVSSNNFFSSRHSHSSGLGNLLNNSSQPYSSLMRWDPSTLSLAQSGSPGLTPQPEDFHNFNVVSLASGGPQVLVYQPGIAQSYFPSHITGAASEYVPKQINFQMLNPNSDNSLSNSLTPTNDSAASQQGRPFHLTTTTTTNFLPTQKDSGNEPNNNKGEFHSR